MADKMRRAKDKIKKSLSSYLNTVTSDYSQYIESSPTYVTYYQYDPAASTQDAGLETVNALTGKNTARKYKRIYDFPIYGVDALDVSNELAERGLQSNVSGEFIVLPNTLRPSPGDIINFEGYDGLDTHLFVVNDVQQDRLTTNKYFKATYSLSPYTLEGIEANVIGDFEVNISGTLGSGTESISIVSSDEGDSIDSVKSLIDGMIDKYESMFYDDETDSFIMKEQYNYDEEKPLAYWSPYLQHFLHETKALDKYKQEIMTEIYITDINETENYDVYSEVAYRNSIFRAIELQNPEFNFDMNFIVVTDEHLKMKRNLPFFMSREEFKLVGPIRRRGKDDPSAYLDAQLLFIDSKPFKDVDHQHKVHVMDDLHVANIEEYLRPNEVVYECKRHELEPTKIAYVYEVNDNGERYLELCDASIEKVIKGTSKLPIKNDFLNIICNYLNGKKITEEEITTLDSMYYEQNLFNYLLMPAIIYILKHSVK